MRIARAIVEPRHARAVSFTRRATNWFVLAALLLFPASIRAQLTYSSLNGAISITGYTGTAPASLSIPDTIDGLPVKAIAAKAFEFRTELKSVVFPSGVTTIENSAFYNCSRLTNVTIPDKVTIIEDSAFAHCYGMRSLTIPSSVTAIGNSAFASCTSLTNLAIPDSVITIGNSAFQQCTGLVSVVIPDRVTNIGASAFRDCSTLSNATIGGSVTNIGKSAFQDCRSLTSVIIGDGLATIGDYAFAFCLGLRSVTLPYSLTTIGASSFLLCGKLAAAYMKGSPPSVGFQAFNLSGVTFYYLPGTTGWGPTFLGRPAVLWNPSAPAQDSGFGIQEGAFAFKITGTSGISVVVEACDDLANPVWVPVGTNTLTGGVSNFTDAAYKTLPSRFYRFRSPN